MKPTGTSGIVFSEPNKDVRDGNLIADTRLNKLHIDTERSPAHLDVIHLEGGTKWVMERQPSQEIEETIFIFRHGMPFTPAFFCWFFLEDDGQEEFSQAGGYAQDIFPMTIDSFVFTERLYAKVDATYFMIKHIAWTSGFAPGDPITVNGHDMKFRIRYEILNRQAIYTGGPGPEFF